EEGGCEAGDPHAISLVSEVLDRPQGDVTAMTMGNDQLLGVRKSAALRPQEVRQRLARFVAGNDRVAPGPQQRLDSWRLPVEGGIQTRSKTRALFKPSRLACFRFVRNEPAPPGPVHESNDPVGEGIVGSGFRVQGRVASSGVQAKSIARTFVSSP